MIEDIRYCLKLRKLRKNRDETDAHYSAQVKEARETK